MKDVLEILSLYWEVFQWIGAAFLVWFIAYVWLTWREDKEEKAHYEDRY